MNDPLFTNAQAQRERKARRMVYTLILVQTLGGMMGAATVLWITGTWPFTFDFLLGYTLTAICMVLMLIGAIFLRFHVRQSVQQEEGGIVLVQGGLTEFDRLVEQQDQEIALYGGVSPFTRLQLHAYAEGKPVPHVTVHSPELERLRQEFLRGMRHGYGPKLPTDDDEFWLWELDDEAEL